MFREVESGTAHYGVVAVENSTDGMVKHTLDCFVMSSLRICAEVELPIHHALLARRDTDPGALREICSHEQSLAQCRHWLDVHHPTVSRRPVASNAEAAHIASQRKGVAAIAGEAAADRYGLVAVHANIEDQADNKTPLLRDRRSAGGAERARPHLDHRLHAQRTRALYKVLEPFHRHGISLTRIESRPLKTSSWQYVFFIDFEGHQSEPVAAGVLAELEGVAHRGEESRLLSSGCDLK